MFKASDRFEVSQDEVFEVFSRMWREIVYFRVRYKSLVGTS